MKILITGITGMVGSHLLDFLFDNTDYEIIGISRWRSPLINIARHIPEINRNQLQKYNIRDTSKNLQRRFVVSSRKPPILSTF